MKAHGQQQYKTIYVEANVMNMYVLFLTGQKLYKSCSLSAI